MILLRIRRRLLLLALCLACAAPGAARELSWRSLDVHARLDADGTLHVLERHAMIFSGDWNGGERTLRVLPGQSFAFESITRIGPDGERHPMSSGDLSAVDQYGWADGAKLRWRSRLPGDPEFANTEIVYEIAYTLSGILVKQGSRYLLDHDFAFPDRPGSIETFTLELTLDPVWKPDGAFSGKLSRKGLVVGEGAVLKVPLEYTGSGRPAAGRTVASPTARKAMFLLLAAAMAFLYFLFRARETALGRFAPLTPPASIDAGWLSANLLSLSPEEAGALWDEKIGAPEVSAVLARLSAEKKIEAHAEAKKLKMRLLVPVESLQGYDHDLLKALFFGGQKETDTDAIRAHYKSAGFDPVSKIRKGLEAKLTALPDFQDKSAVPSRRPTAILLGLAIAALVLSVVFAGEDAGTIIGIGIVQGILWGAGAACAYSFQKRIDRLDAHSPVFLWVPLLLLYYAWAGARADARSGWVLVAGVYLLRLAIVSNIFNLAKTRNGPRRIARRKALASARNFFAHELGRPSPALKDDWFPYVVAFGLTGEADHWFRVHGSSAGATASTTSFSSGSSSSSSSASSGSSGSWSGGGGAFGGAGASGSWAVAAGALAAGVASPSSSSGGGGGGGGGGGSSGGGGGGGW